MPPILADVYASPGSGWQANGHSGLLSALLQSSLASSTVAGAGKLRSSFAQDADKQVDFLPQPVVRGADSSTAPLRKRDRGLSVFKDEKSGEEDDKGKPPAEHDKGATGNEKNAPEKDVESGKQLKIVPAPILQQMVQAQQAGNQAARQMRAVQASYTAQQVRAAQQMLAVQQLLGRQQAVAAQRLKAAAEMLHDAPQLTWPGGEKKLPAQQGTLMPPPMPMSPMPPPPPRTWRSAGYPGVDPWRRGPSFAVFEEDPMMAGAASADEDDLSTSFTAVSETTTRSRGAGAAAAASTVAPKVAIAHPELQSRDALPGEALTKVAPSSWPSFFPKA